MPQSRQALIDFLRAASRDTTLLDYQIMLDKVADDLEAQKDERADGRAERSPAP